MNLIKISAETISWMFLPFLVPIFGILITLYMPSEPLLISSFSMYTLPKEIKENILSVYFIFSFVAPGISFISLKRRGFIKSLEMQEQGDRFIPMLIMLSYCLVMFTLFILKDPQHYLPYYISSLPLTGAIVSLVFAIINLRFKISLHAGGMGILVGYLIAFNAGHVYASPWFIILFIILSGVIASARMYLKCHDLKQISFGWIIALIISFLTNYYYKDVFEIFI